MLNSIFDELTDKSNSIVFFDLCVGESKSERVFFELFNNITPKTCENFSQLCTGEQIRNGKPIGYKNTHFHRIVKDFVVQGEILYLEMEKVHIQFMVKPFQMKILE